MSKKLVVPTFILMSDHDERQPKAEKEYDAECEAFLKDIGVIKDIVVKQIKKVKT